MRKYLSIGCFLCVAVVAAVMTVPAPVAAATGVVAAASLKKRLAVWLLVLFVLGIIAFFLGHSGRFGGGRRRRR